MLMFSLAPAYPFALALAEALDVTLSPHEERLFPDGECKLRPLVDPRGADAYVVHSLHGGPIDSPHDKLCRLLMFIATLKDHGAARVTAVVPYLAYARKDQQTKPHDPVNLRYVAQLFDAVGVAQLIVLEAHNVAAFQNAFRCPTVHLSAHPVFGELAQEIAATGPLAVASPDPGGVKRALLWREDTLGKSHVHQRFHFRQPLQRRLPRIRGLLTVVLGRNVPVGQPAVVVGRPDQPVKVDFAGFHRRGSVDLVFIGSLARIGFKSA